MPLNKHAAVGSFSPPIKVRWERSRRVVAKAKGNPLPISVYHVLAPLPLEGVLSLVGI